MTAKNAPSANDTPNNSDKPNATPSAIASTHNVNSSREPVPATRSRIHGITRLPTISISAMNAPTLRNVVNSAVNTEVASAASPLSSPASAGSSTSASTQAMSSTISQPTAMRPRWVSTSRRSSSARSSTTVLAHDSDRPNTKPAPCDHPNQRARPQP